MRCGEELRRARQRARLTQRELAHRTGVAQPTIARIERGLVDPRTTTLERLLTGCGTGLAVREVSGLGIDRSQMRELLKLTPRQRLDSLRDDATGLARFDRALGR
jgi:predicted transcriptional regulator